MVKLTNIINRVFHKNNRNKKFDCYEIWRPNIPIDGCKKQCKECAEKQALIK